MAENARVVGYNWRDDKSKLYYETNLKDSPILDGRATL